MDNEEELRQQKRHLQQQYEEQLDDLTRQQHQVDQEAEELAQRANYWLEKLNPQESKQQMYQIANNYQQQAQDVLQHQKRKLSDQFEDQAREIQHKLRG
ncbi:hypothetical protein [Bombilactobacillus thymidiniphilus]|uniref:Uncharacterized protein n=1 Tax=Bombilactobacillus thymidiniphilus TaxID=2923363 RepID=A0ABY4PET6_9LACO|nr:hypothetical protein [Bombilactobacillus thymidiniphilus]UQS84260.1 hypothetical protein MOO47_03675 [Bombilactobacillus thymidiniphilus]